METFPTNSITRRSIAPRCVIQVLLPVAARSLYETPSDKGFEVESFVLVNGTGNRVTVRLHHVLARESVAQRNGIVYDLAMQPYSTLALDIPVYMLAGDSIYGLASAASSIACLIYGRET
jgi:hypothetical protein